MSSRISLPSSAAVSRWGLTAAVFACACQPNDSKHGIFELEAALAPAVNTVVELEWSSYQPGRSWVEYSVDGGPLYSTDTSLDASTFHHMALVGLPAFAEVDYEVFTEGTDHLDAESGWIETAGVPAGIPDLVVTVHQASAMSSEPYLLAAVAGTESFLLAIDRAGQVLWYRELSNTWPDHMVMSSDVVRGGPDLLLSLTSRLPETNPGKLITLDLLGQVVDELDIGWAHHDMVQLPDGGVAVLQHDLRSWFDPEQGLEVEVIGDAIVEFAPDGSSRQVYSTWDWREPEVHERFYKPGALEGDWTHANGLHFDEDSGTYMMSLGYVNTVLQVSAASGELVREFGGEGYRVVQGEPFVFQHDPNWTEDGTLLMSSSIGESHRVMAIEYALDDLDESLSERWSFGKDEAFESMAGGQAFRLDNGNTLLNTGYRGLLVEVSPEGEPVWELSSQMGGVFISVVFFEDFYGSG